jgi:L-rhamnose-H+ transport protein
MDFPFGLALVFASGIMAGSTLSPIKFMQRYRFENYWLIHSLVGTVIIPWTLALSTVPNLLQIYAKMPLHLLVLPPLFAFTWGIASTLGGLCVARIGLSLTYALVIGFGAAAGALVPLLYFSPDTLFTSAGHFILTGVAVMILGLFVVARAGRAKELKERATTETPNQHGSDSVIKGSFLVGLAMAIIAGILSAGLNFSFAFGGPIAQAAISAGASRNNATYALWALAMTGGMIPNIAYALFLCVRNQSWTIFLGGARTDMPLSILMGTLFMGSTAVYGLGAVRLGALGTSVGWAIMQIMQIVVGNMGGWLTGEWKLAGSSATRQMIAGLVILTVASIEMAFGNYLEQSDFRPTRQLQSALIRHSGALPR